MMTSPKYPSRPLSAYSHALSSLFYPLLGERVRVRGNPCLRSSRHTPFLLCALLVLAVQILLTAPLHAQDPVSDGVTWLESNQNTDGSWGSGQERLRTTCRAIEALYSADATGAAFVQGLAWLDDAVVLNDDYAARKLYTNMLTGQSSGGLGAILLDHATAEGGWGFDGNHYRDLLTSSLVVQALRDWGVTTATAFVSGLSYIRFAQDPAGYWPWDNGDPSVYLTVLCLDALRGDDNSQGALSVGLVWLLNNQNPDGGFGSEGSTVYETALTSLLLLAEQTGTSARIAARAHLEGAQESDGSWGHDSYLTAMAVKALSQAVLPDLEITESDVITNPVTIYEGDDVTVTVHVRNTGDESAQNVPVVLYADAAKVGTVQTITSIPAGGIDSTAFIWGTGDINGYVDLHAWIDSSDVIRELNESNNDALKQVFVIDLTPPGADSVYVSAEYFSPNGDGIKDETRLYFDLADYGTVSVRILEGEDTEVRTLASEVALGSGLHSYTWDGRSENGEVVPDGQYRFELRTYGSGGASNVASLGIVVDTNRSPLIQDMISGDYVVLQYTETGLCNGPRWSPSGDRIAYGQGSHVWVMDADGTGEEQVSTLPWYSNFGRFECAWSPDGRYLLVASGTRPEVDLWKIDTSTGAQWRLTDSAGSGQWHRSAAWSPDGDLIAFEAFDDSGYVSVWTMNHDGSGAIRVIDDADQPEWSPSSDHILYKGIERYDFSPYSLTYWPSSFQLWVAERNGNGQRFLCEAGAELRGAVWNPPQICWMPGTDSFYSTRIQMAGGPGIHIWTRGIRRMALDGTGVQLIIDDGAAATYPGTGDWLVFSRAEWDSPFGGAVWAKNLKTEEMVQIQVGEEIRALGDFSPDGSKLLFTAPEWSPSGHIYAVVSLRNLVAHIDQVSRTAENPGALTIRGTASDANFEKYQLFYGQGEDPLAFHPAGPEQSAEVRENDLGVWVPPGVGTYTLRLDVWDKAGNTASDYMIVQWIEDQRLAGCHAVPNPFSPNADGAVDTCNITYTALEAGVFDFEIVDQGGTPVWSTSHTHSEPADSSFLWTGTSALGDTVPDGQYRLAIDDIRLPLDVDTTPPIVELDPGEGASVIATVLDEHLCEWRLDWYVEAFSLWFPLENGRRELENQMFTLTTTGLVIGEHDFRLIGLDCAANQDTAIATVMFEYDENESDSTCIKIVDPNANEVLLAENHWIKANVGQAQAVTTRFSVKENDSSSWGVIGTEPIMYGQAETLWDLSNTSPGHYDMRAEALDQYEAVLCSDIITVGVQVGLFIGFPTPNCPVSGDVRITVYYLGGAEELNYATLQHRDPSGDNLQWEPIGDASGEAPFTVMWDTRTIPDGMRELSVSGTTISGIWLNNAIQVRISNCPPYVLLVSPQTGQVMDDRIRLEATAFVTEECGGDSSEIVRVVFGARDSIGVWETLGEDAGAPYVLMWDASVKPEGILRLAARGEDNYDRFGYSPVVNCYVDHTDPTAIISSPSSGTPLTGEPLEITGTAQDDHFSNYMLEVGAGNSPSSWARVESSVDAIESGPLGTWHAEAFPGSDYTIRLEVTDKGGRTATDCVLVTLDNDTVRPLAVIMEPLAGTHVAGQVDVIGAAYSPVLDQYVLEYGAGSSPGSWTSIATDSVSIQHGVLGTWDVTSLADGQYTIRLTATDEESVAGVDSVFVVVDGTDPLATITFPPADTLLTSSTIIHGTASDAHLSRHTIFVGPGSEPDYWSTVCQGTSSVTNGPLGTWWPLPPDGVQTLKLMVVDSPGNEASDLRTLATNAWPPAAPSRPDASVDGLVVSLWWQANAEGDMAGYKVYRDGASQTASPVETTAWSDTVAGPGEYEYTITAVDTVGWESPHSPERVVEAEASIPIVRITYPDSGQGIRGAVHVLGTAASADLSWYTLEYAPGMTPSEDEFVGIVYGTASVSLGELGIWETSWIDTVCTLRLSAEDAGGGSASCSVMVVVDNTPPAVPTGLTATPSGDDVDLLWDANADVVEGYLAYRDGFLLGAPENYTDPMDYLISGTSVTDSSRGDGTYEYRVCAADSVGNISQPSDSAVAAIETGAPVAWVAFPAESARVAGTVLVKAASDAQDIAHVTLQYVEEGGGGWATIGVDSMAPYQADWETGSLSVGTYALRAVATDSSANTDGAPDSIMVFVVDDADPPAVPTGLAATVSQDTVYLQWNSNTEDDLSGYYVYRDSTLITGSLLGSSEYVDGGLDEDFYDYAVTAVDTASNESGAATVEEVLVDITPPSIEIVSPESAQAVGGEWRIRALIIEDHMDRWSLWAGQGISPTSWDQLAFGSAVSWEDEYGRYDTLMVALWDTEALTGVWSFRLDAVDLVGQTGGDTVWCSIDDSPPAAPTGFVATGQGEHRIDLAWDANTEPDLDFYRIYRADGFDEQFVFESTSTWYTYGSMHLESGVVYYYAVTAVDEAGNESAFSESDSAMTFDSGPPVAPAGLAAEEGNLSVVLTWQANTEPDIAGYHVYRDGGRVTADSIRALSYVDIGLDAGTSYSFQVSAVDWSGSESSLSGAVPAMPWGVDLLISDNDISVYPEELLPGEQARVVVTIHNVGTGPSPTAGLTILAYDDDSVETLLRGDLIPELAVGDSVRFGTDWFVGYQPGPRHIVAIADAAGRVAEIDENNNTGHKAIEVLSSLVVLQTWTDAASYWANQDVVLTADVENTGGTPDTVSVRCRIETVDGTILAELDEEEIGELVPGETERVLTRWNTGSTVPGTYVMRTRVMSSWEVLDEDEVTFTIRANTGMETWVNSDAMSYLANETVRFACGIKNLSGNQAVDSLDARLYVVRAGSDTLATYLWEVAQVEPEGIHETEQMWETGTESPGSFSAGFLVLSKEGDLLASSTTSFSIQASSEDSTYQLTGWIRALPNKVEPDDSTTIHYELENLGNQSVANLDVVIGIVDVQASSLAKDWSRSASLGIGASVVDSVETGGSGLDWKPYMLWLGAVVNGDTVSVASGALMVTDLTCPVLSEVTPDSGSFQRGDVSIHVRATDNHDGVAEVSYRLDGASWEALPLISGDALDGAYEMVWHTTSGDDGRRVMEMTAIDSAWNQLGDTLSIPFIVDNVAPETELTVTDTLYDDGDQYYAYEECGYVLQAGDTLSGVAQILVSIDGGPQETYTDTLWLSGEDDHTLAYGAVDSAGNEETTHDLVITIPPQIRVAFGGIGKLVSFPVVPMAGEIMDSIPAGSYVYRLLPGGSDFVLADTIKVGEGYWVLAPEDSTVRWKGEPVGGFTYQVATGWNLVGSIFGPEDFSSPMTEPGGAVGGGCWHYDSGWVWSDTLQPRRGHYVAAYEDALLKVGTEARGMVLALGVKEERPDWLVRLALANGQGTARAACGVARRASSGIDRRLDRPVPAALRAGDAELYFPVTSGAFSRLAVDVRGPDDAWTWEAIASSDQDGILTWNASEVPAGHGVRFEINGESVPVSAGGVSLSPGEHRIVIHVEQTEEELELTKWTVDKCIEHPDGLLIWEMTDPSSSDPFSPMSASSSLSSLSPLLGERVRVRGNPITTVQTREAFIPELRNGLHSTVAITGESVPIDSSLIGELGLFVRRGNRLVVFDGEGGLAKQLELILGIKVTGGTQYVDEISTAGDELIAAGTWEIGSEAPLVKVEEAVVVASSGDLPVVTVRELGYGHAIYAGISAETIDAALANALCTSLIPSPRGEGQGEGRTSPRTGGARVVNIKIRVNGEGRGQVREKLSDGIKLVDHGSGDISGPTLSWYIELDKSGKELGYSGVLPDIRGRYRVETEVRPLRGGVYRREGWKSAEATVEIESREALRELQRIVAANTELKPEIAAECMATLEQVASRQLLNRKQLGQAIAKLSDLSLRLERERSGPEIQEPLAELVAIYTTIWSYWPQGGSR